MEATAAAKGPDAWRSLFRPLIVLLAVGMEPVDLAWLADISGLDQDDIRESLTAWSRFLRRERRLDGEAWTVLHRSFTDFLEEVVDIPRGHRTVANSLRPQGRWGAHSGYARRHLSAHFRLGEDLDGLFELAADREWYAAQMRADPTGVTYELDADQAWVAASGANQATIASGDGAPRLGEEIRWALVTATLADYWRNIRPGVVAQLAALGVLSGSQALQLATRNPDVLYLAIGALAPTLGEDVVAAARLARTIEDPWQRGSALLALLPVTPAGDRFDLVEEALAATLAAEDSVDKVSQLQSIADELPEPRRSDVGDQAITSARSIRDPEERASALLELAAESPKRDHLFQEARDAFSAVDDPSKSIEVLPQLISLAPHGDRVDLTRTAMALVSKIEDVEARATGLASLLPVVSGPERSRIIRSAKAATRSVADPADRIRAILELAQQLDGRQRKALLVAARDIVPQVADQIDRLGLAAEVAAKDGDVGSATRFVQELGAQPLRVGGDAIGELIRLATTIDEMRQPTLNVAVQIARGIADPIERARSLIAVAMEVADDQRGPLVREAVSIPGSILAAGGSSPDEVERAEILGRLARRVRSDLRQSMIETALGYTQEIVRPYDRSRVLVALIPAADGPQKEELFAEAVAELDGLDDAGRAEIATALLPHASGDERDRLLAVGLAAAKAIVPGQILLSLRVNMYTAVVTGDRTSKLAGLPSAAFVGLLDQVAAPRRGPLIRTALASVYHLPSTFQPRALNELAPHLNAAQVRSVLTHYRLVATDPLRDRVRALLMDGTPDAEGSAAKETVADTDAAAIASQPSPPDDSHEADDQAEQRGGEVGYQMNVVSPGAMFGLTPIKEQAAFEIVFDAPDEIDTDQRADLERRIVEDWMADQLVEADPNQLDHLLAAAAGLTTGWEWLQAIGALVSRLAGFSGIDEARVTLETIWPDRLPAQLVAALAFALPASEVERLALEALEPSTLTAEPADRAAALTAALPLLRGPDRGRALEDIGQALATVLDQNGAKELIRFAFKLPDLPPASLLPHLQMALLREPDRRALLEDVRDNLDWLFAVGGPTFPESAAQAIIDVSSWWS